MDKQHNWGHRFIDKYLQQTTTVDQIDKFVKEWDQDPNCNCDSLHQHLGISSDDYDRWLEDSKSLKGRLDGLKMV